MDINRDKIIILACGFITFMLKFVFCFFRADMMVQPYPFNNQLISVQAYVDYLANAVVFIIIFAMFRYLLPQFRFYLGVITWIWIGYMLDYILTYNTPLSYYHFQGYTLPVSYCTFGGLCFVGMISYELFLYFKRVLA